MAVQRIVVLRGERIDVDVDVDDTRALSFLIACHDNFPDASLYLEGELVEPVELDALIKRFTSAATESTAAGPVAQEAAPPAPAPPAPTPPVVTLADFKEATELVGNSLERLLNFQIAAFARCSDTMHRHLDQLLSHDHKLAEECARQRKQHREALHEIDVFDRGTKVAVMAEEAELRSGHARQKSEVDGFTRSDFIEGFSRLAVDPRQA